MGVFSIFFSVCKQLIGKKFSSDYLFNNQFGSKLYLVSACCFLNNVETEKKRQKNENTKYNDYFWVPSLFNYIVSFQLMY